MSAATIAPTPSISYSIENIKDEVRQLIEQGIISRQQPIYTLCKFIPAREWIGVECELERAEYLLRDSVADLVAEENWDND